MKKKEIHIINHLKNKIFIKDKSKFPQICGKLFLFRKKIYSFFHKYGGKV